MHSCRAGLAAALLLLRVAPRGGAAALPGVELEPPRLVGSSNNSATHYWFPSNMAVVFNESHLLLDARLADDCSDYFCNKTNTCKSSDPSHQVSLSTDGGSTFTPMWEVGGSSPWSPGLNSRPFLGSCTVVLNDTARLSLYQGKIWSPWKSKAAVFNLDSVVGLRWQIAERAVSYGGAEGVCGTGHLWGQNAIEIQNDRAHDRNLLLSAQCDVKVGRGPTERKEATALIFSSSDGYDWELKSTVPVIAPAGVPPCTSPGENTIVELTGHRLLLVARCGDGQQLLGWVSTDKGSTWRRHKMPDNMRGVMPVAIRMDNSAVVMTTGRGGLALWLNAKGDGEEWELTNLSEKHNLLIHQNSKLNGTSLQYTDAWVQFNATGESTSYNTLRKLGANDGIVCYDRTSSSSAVPGRPSCSPPGNRDKNEKLFCMRFHVTSIP